MIRTNHLIGLVADRRMRYKIGAVAAAAVAAGASPAAAQYGTDAPLPPLPALQGTAAPTDTPPAGPPAGPGAAVSSAPAPRPATAPPPGRATAPATAPATRSPGDRSGVAGTGASGDTVPSGGASPSGVAGAVGSGDVVPAGGTAGEVRDTGVGAPTVNVVSTERAEPVAISGDDLPFTGARIGLLAAIGAGLVALGFGVRRRSALRTAKP